MMEIILLKRVEKLGQMGQVVKVRPGFARNFLLPQKKALRATKDNLAYFEKQRHQLYGSVTARDIADAVTEAGFTVARAQVVLVKAIKTLGLHKQRVVLHPEV